MEIVRSVNRSWIYDSYYSLYMYAYMLIIMGEMSGDKMSGGIVRGICPDTREPMDNSPKKKVFYR